MTAAPLSEGLHDDGVQQGHVLGSSDRQLVCGVVMNDLGDGEEGGAVLPQNVTAVRRLGELHVHEALTAPDRKEENLLVQFIPNWNDANCSWCIFRFRQYSYVSSKHTTSRIYEGCFDLEQLRLMK